jgi:hypothetical protein
LSFKQWHNISKGYYDKIERQTRLQWETTRMLMYVTLLPHKKKGSDLTPQEMFPFNWDTENNLNKVVDIPKVEDVLESKKRWKNRDNKNKK